MRQLYAKLPCRFTSGPYISSTFAGSLLKSVISGTDVCILYAISYWLMPVLTSGPPRHLRTGQEEADGRCVVHLRREHRLHEATLVRDARGVRHEVTHPGTALSVLAELGDLRQARAHGLAAGHRAEPRPLHHTVR